jgi:4-hydroxythreonine-4-phosphate dehydrogenase
VATAARFSTRDDIDLVLLGDRSLLQSRAAAIGIALSADCALMDIPLAVPAVAGRPDPRNAHSVLRTLDVAIDGCLGGDFDAIVTAPVQKSTINDAGIPFSGHTEYLASQCGARRVQSGA